MRCTRCRRIVRDPVYFRGKPYGMSCAKKKGYGKTKVPKTERSEFQLDLFNPFLGFDNFIDGLEW